MSLGLGLASIGLGLGQGFAFGTGYGAGVRFGYEDVYPYLKNNLSAIGDMLNIPFASSGFKLASGVTEKQGMGLTDTPKTGMMGLGTPEEKTSTVNHAGTVGHPLSAGELDHIRKITGVGDVIGLQKFENGVILKRNGKDYIVTPNGAQTQFGARQIQNGNLYTRLLGLVR